MPHSYIEAETPPSSSSSANCSSSPPKKGGELSQSQQFPPSGSSRSKNTEGAEDFSLEATEPFPDDLFRIPVRDAFFREIPELSDVALRSLLALIHLSHRYDPAEESWTHTEEWLPRSEIEEAAGISSQGTRDGLEELEASGWAQANREGRSYSYQLLLEVPDRRYTYLPTELLEKTSELGSAELRVLLVVLRKTWGWTETKQKPEGGDETVHARWTGLSTQDLSDATGRSETAVKGAAKGLEGEWIERARPSSGAYQYRFLPEVVSESSRDNSSSSEDTSKNLTPHRQNSAPPSSYRESLPRDKHSQSEEKKEPSARLEKSEATEEENALPSENTSKQKQSNSEDPAQPEQRNQETSEPDFSDLPPEKRELAQKLANVGVWPRRIAEVLSHYSKERIRANFQLYRRRAAENTIHSGGAWLYQAITEGYALPSSQGENRNSRLSSQQAPEHKEIVSEEEKEAYINRGVPEERFHRCLSSEKGARFMYLDHDEGPAQRVENSRP